MSNTSGNDYQGYNPRPGSKADLFLQLADPDYQGYSREVQTSEFVDNYADLKLGNGGSWCRDDSRLGRHFNIVRKKKGNRIISIKLEGRSKQSVEKPIPIRIQSKMKEKRCVILSTGNSTEADHKDGRRDDPRLSDVSSVSEKDFQPMSKAANNAKKQHCKDCRNTNKRFDAKLLGYSISQTKGGREYVGSCVGCYWHDPLEFNKLVSSNYIKTV